MSTKVEVYGIEQLGMYLKLKLLEPSGKMRDVPHNTSINACRLALMEFQNHMYCHHSEGTKKIKKYLVGI